IVPVIEGSRSLLIELQALVSTSAFSAPQRLTTGVNYKRVSILLAVLEKRLDINFKTRDVHINITGGFQVDEPAIDLGIIGAVISSFRDKPLPDGIALVGEVGLAGEVRAVSRIDQRIKEAGKLGFKRVIIPEGNLKSMEFDPEMTVTGIKDINQLLNYIGEVE
ncbi:MAG TPA: S16 family serine protease, partial [Halanaerobiales bacterium]|nr:S16 family serine protease [Halanaerobiales bacterium]